MSEQAENSGDHFEMYKSPDALCCVPATTSTGGQIHFKNKLTEREMRSVVTRRNQEGELEEGGQRYKLAVVR